MLEVIGAGFGRTGTASTKAALEILLGRPCYHMFEALAHLDHHPAWLAAATATPRRLSAVLDGYGATVDWPGCSLWRELMEVHPEAKVLLTTRSFPAPYADQSPEQLVDSYERHNREVVDAVPAERLLVYDVTDGWEPLCAFLGVPVPDQPVPSFNDRQAFRDLFGLDRVVAPEPTQYSKEQVEGHFRDALPDTGHR